MPSFFLLLYDKTHNVIKSDPFVLCPIFNTEFRYSFKHTLSVNLCNTYAFFCDNVINDDVNTVSMWCYSCCAEMFYGNIRNVLNKRQLEKKVQKRCDTSLYREKKTTFIRQGHVHIITP